MSKILFISSNLSTSLSGGWQCSNRNLESVVQIYGKDNVEIKLLSPFSTQDKRVFHRLQLIIGAVIRLIFTCRMNGISSKLEKQILFQIKEKQYDYVFIDSSLCGFLVKNIKKETNVRILSFFHNCENFFIKKQLYSDFSFGHLFRLYPSYKNEKLTLDYSDKVVVLNTRDEDLLRKIYNYVGNIQIIPISLKDRVINESKLNVTKEGDNLLEVLFIGSNFYANREGITWFIKKVLPYVSIKLIIVGKDMDRLQIPSNQNITICSSVSSVDQYYINSDLVIAPIFTGGGMKVKIAEALMFGKSILGTEEALQGYDRVDSLVECADKEDYIEALNGIILKPFRKDSRDLFLKKYSFEATLTEFKRLFEN